MRTGDWCDAVMAGVVDEEPRPHLHCRRCGERLVTETPIRLDTYIAITKAFIKAHSKCQPPAAPVIDLMAALKASLRSGS